MTEPTDTFATEAKPRWAVIAWVDDHNVFIEIPIKDQAPFVAKFLNSPQGLAEALTRMRDYHKEMAGPSKYIPTPRAASGRPSQYGLSTRAKAQEILRKMGLTG